MPFTVCPDEKGEKLFVAEFAALAGKLVGKPIAIVFAVSERTTSQKLESIAIAHAIYLLHQMKNVGLEPVAWDSAGAGMGRNAL